jgi:branched-subunit amino acid aminotransferase/4-amino-4-deoxychorismate lyase
VCEAASANLFWVKNATLYTPAVSTGCLRGVTRSRLLALSPWPVEEVSTPLEGLEKAEALWLTNGRIGIHPVAEIIPHGYRYAPHPFTAQLQQLLKDDQQREAAQQHGGWV